MNVLAKPRRGRPTKYSVPLGKAICKMLSEGMSLRAICRRPRMPHERTVRGWALDPKHPFSPQYDRARLIAYHGLGDELLEIADDSSNDWAERQNRDGSTNSVIDHDNIARARLRIDARKWFLAKMLPKIYGDKLEAATSKEDGPIQPVGPRSTGEDHLAALAERYANGLREYYPADAPGKAPKGS